MFSISNKVKDHCSNFSKLVELRLRELLLLFGMKINDEANALCPEKGIFWHTLEGAA